VYVAIQIGPRQSDDQREVWMNPLKFLNGPVTPPGVKRDQQVAVTTIIALTHDDFVTEATQQARPSERGHFIAVVDAQRRRRDEVDNHGSDYFAQVRNPAQTSRRSGV
jgi:uncharacterized protein (UPF0218 family)